MCVNKNAEYDVIAKEIDALREKKAAVVTKDAEQEMLRKRINEMRHFLQTQTSRITEYDEQLVRRLIEKITVYDDKLIFEFKSGMTIELKRLLNSNYYINTLQQCRVFLPFTENLQSRTVPGLKTSTKWFII